MDNIQGFFQGILGLDKKKSKVHGFLDFQGGLQTLIERALHFVPLLQSFINHLGHNKMLEN